jgi:hypothetical protein
MVRRIAAKVAATDPVERARSSSAFAPWSRTASDSRGPYLTDRVGFTTMSRRPRLQTRSRA